MIREKVARILTSSLNLVLCVGESDEVRKKNMHQEFVEEQLKRAFASMNSGMINDYDKIIIAYEPVWAIGTGIVATTPDVYYLYIFRLKKCIVIFDRS